jgi:hypothetical protein
MKVLIAQSIKSTPKDAVLELKEKFSNNINNVRAITFFASSIYEPSELTNAMNENFPNIQVFGCSTSGEIISGKINSNSIVAMALTDEVIEDMKIEVVNNISKNLDLQPSIKSLEDYYKTPLNRLDEAKYFGLIYMDGLSAKEEEILDELSDHTNVMFVGGSAGDDLKFAKTIIYANGKHYDNAAVMVLIKSKVAFSFEKIQSFVPTEHTVVATKVDEPNRIIYELNNKPAAEVYAELLKTTLEDAPKYFAEYAFGLMAEGQPFLRSIQQIVNGNALKLYCNVHTGTELKIMKTGDMIADTKNSLEEIKKRHKSISGVLIFNCILRYLELQNKNKTDDYGNIFKDVPTVGFSTYGEAYIGHINQTATFLVLE